MVSRFDRIESSWLGSLMYATMPFQNASFIASQFVPENRDVASPGNESLSAA